MTDLSCACTGCVGADLTWEDEVRLLEQAGVSATTIEYLKGVARCRNPATQEDGLCDKCRNNQAERALDLRFRQNDEGGVTMGAAADG